MKHKAKTKSSQRKEQFFRSIERRQALQQNWLKNKKQKTLQASTKANDRYVHGKQPFMVVIKDSEIKATVSYLSPCHTRKHKKQTTVPRADVGTLLHRKENTSIVKVLRTYSNIFTAQLSQDGRISLISPVLFPVVSLLFFSHWSWITQEK